MQAMSKADRFIKSMTEMPAVDKKWLFGNETDNPLQFAFDAKRVVHPSVRGKTISEKEVLPTWDAFMRQAGRRSKRAIYINDVDASVNRKDIKALIALVPQEKNFDRELTVYENMLVYGMLYNIGNLQKNIADKLSMLGLTEEKDTIAEHLSGGMQRRLLIARALLSKPEIIFLDEPTIGLDPRIRREIWDIVVRLKYSGKTIFMTTHYMEEAEALCDRVAFISKGELITAASPDELKDAKGGYVVEKKNGDGMASRTFYKHRHEAEEIVRLSNNGAIVRKTNLEDIFIELTGDEINERG